MYVLAREMYLIQNDCKKRFLLRFAILVSLFLYGYPA